MYGLYGAGVGVGVGNGDCGGDSGFGAPAAVVGWAELSEMYRAGE